MCATDAVPHKFSKKRKKKPFSEHATVALFFSGIPGMRKCNCVSCERGRASYPETDELDRGKKANSRNAERESAPNYKRRNKKRLLLFTEFETQFVRFSVLKLLLLLLLLLLLPPPLLLLPLGTRRSKEVWRLKLETSLFTLL